MVNLARNMPVILPDQLFGWMTRAGIWPKMEEANIRAYWNHLRNVRSPLATMSDGTHIPLYLWGDGAQFTESGQSMMVFACGFILDENRSNVFPLWMCREETCTCTCVYYLDVLFMLLRWLQGYDNCNIFRVI